MGHLGRCYASRGAPSRPRGGGRGRGKPLPRAGEGGGFGREKTLLVKPPTPRGLVGFGKPLNWADVEADEVDLAKTEVPNAGPHTMKPIQRDQWGGIVQRGDPKSLVLFKLKPERTKRRAPGPGPIRKRDWAPLAEKWLKNRAVVLHTGGAKSYRMKVDGVKHDWVVHMEKKPLK